MTDVRWASDGSDAAVVARIAAVVAGPGSKHVAVAGGSTPKPIFSRLAAQDLDWPTVTLWPSDERIVPATDEASNIGALRRAFGKTGAHLQALAVGQEVPTFALVWLGMGTDGHVASLFPGNDPDRQAPRAVLRVWPDPLPLEAPFERLTLTLAALAEAREIIVVIRGEAKRQVLTAALAGLNDLPVARLINAARGPVTIYWTAA